MFKSKRDTMTPRGARSVRMSTRASISAIAVVAASGLVLSGCGEAGAGGGAAADRGAEQSPDALRIGTLLPQTGQLAYLAPGPRAAAHLAVEEINAAGGVLGHDAEIVVDADEGDAADPSVVARGVDDILAANPSFVLGAMGTAMTNAAMPRLTEAGVLIGSPANAGDALTGINDLYFRTAPPDSLQGRALGNLIAQDGKAKVAVLAFEDSGTGLRDRLEETLTEQGADVVYGAQGAGEELSEDQTSFSSVAAAVQAADPDAVVVLAYEQTRQIISELANQDVDLANLYLVDGNTNDFGPGAEAGGLDAGLLEGAQGTIPGAQVDGEFRDELIAAYEEAEGARLDAFDYAPEAYDAVALVALAAQRGGAADSQTIAENLRAVSGSGAGEECSTYAACLELLEAGEEIHYAGKAGIGPITAENDPSTALFGVYQYDEDNRPRYVRSIEG